MGVRQEVFLGRRNNPVSENCGGSLS